MTDIDHILSMESIDKVRNFDGDKVMFPREWAVLTEDGEYCQDFEVLIEYGLEEKFSSKQILHAGMHANTFGIKKSIFDTLEGYDEKFCGRYGGDDTDFANRYSRLYQKGLVGRHIVGPPIGVYPNPRKDVKKIFHKLRYK